MTEIGFSDIIGLMGVSLLISTYGLLQFDGIDPKGFWYSFNNMIVAILVTISLIYNFNLASMVIEVFWFSLSLYGLIKYLRLARKKHTMLQQEIKFYED